MSRTGFVYIPVLYVRSACQATGQKKHPMGIEQRRDEKLCVAQTELAADIECTDGRRWSPEACQVCRAKADKEGRHVLEAVRKKSTDLIRMTGDR